MRVLWLTLVFLLLPRTAWGDPPPLVPVPQGPDVITPMRRGEPSPTDGQLFDQPTAMRWANYLQQCHLRLKLDVEAQARVDQLTIDLLTQKLELERRQYSSVTLEFQKKLMQVQLEVVSPPWYKTLWFGVLLGTAGTIAIVAATASVFSASK